MEGGNKPGDEAKVHCCELLTTVTVTTELQSAVDTLQRLLQDFQVRGPFGLPSTIWRRSFAHRYYRLINGIGNKSRDPIETEFPPELLQVECEER